MSAARPRTIWDVVHAQAEQSPCEVAVRGARQCSYQQLMECVDAVASRIESCAGRASVVAIEASGTAAVIATLAVARAGCAALPLSTESPPIHRQAVLRDARPVAFLQEDDTGELLVRSVALAGGGATAAGGELPNVAYVMYTSGSTGRPKGVIVPHSALLDRLDGLAQFPGLDRGESMVAMTPLSFDISMAELLLPLTVGGSVIAAPPETRLNPEVFVQLVEDADPDVIQATPSFWRLALAWGWGGAQRSRVWCGGESLTPALADQLLPRCKELWNVYGPTEATIWAGAARVESVGPIALGDPLPRTGMFLADIDAKNGGTEITAADRPGEILLYGAGLALGYLNRDELTAQRFRVRQTPDGVQTCYYTGDRAQYRADGTLEFLGRTDGQIKLRGHRIELGEIEAVLEECPGVSEAAAVVGHADQPERAHIAAFLVVDAAVMESDLRGWLTRHLPFPMHPATISVVNELPRTAAGKIDRVRLAGHCAPLGAVGSTTFRRVGRDL